MLSAGSPCGSVRQAATAATPRLAADALARGAPGAAYPCSPRAGHSVATPAAGAGPLECEEAEAITSSGSSSG